MSIIQQSFAGGEWSPSLYARTDLAQYRTAVRTMKNFVLHPHGYVKNRGGSYFLSETKDSSKKSRLIPFQFSAGDAYCIELGHNYLRIISNGGFISQEAEDGIDLNDTETYEWCTLATTTPRPYYLRAADEGDPEISRPQKIWELVGEEYVELEYEMGNIRTAASGRWQWFFYDPYWTIGIKPYGGSDVFEVAEGLMACYHLEYATTYDEDDLFDIKIIQNADVIYFSHPSYPPKKLTRTNDYEWTFASVSFGASQAAPTNLTRSDGTSTGNNYVVTAVNADGEESVACTAVEDCGPGDTFTWTAASGASYYNVYKDSNASGIYGWIGRATSNTFKEPSAWLDPDFSKCPPIAQTVFNAEDNYPAAVAFFQQRLCWARTNDHPQTVWGSCVGNFLNHNISTPLRDDDAFSFTIASNQINQILWVASLKDLIIGTAGSEWRMSPSIDDSTITPVNVVIRKESSWGSANIAPIIIGNDLLFVDATKKVIRNFKSAINIEGAEEYGGNDLSILASHLFENYTIVDWAYQQQPDNIIWVVRNDGTLLGLTYFREHQVWGWHQHTTQGYFESVCTLLKTNGTYETYVLVRRTINGETKRYIELLMDRLPINDSYEKDIEKAFFVDCGLSLNNPHDITAITKADPCVITSASHDLTTGDYIDVREVGGMTELNGNRYKVIVLTDDTFSITDEDDEDIDSTEYTAYVSGGVWRKAVTSITGLGHLEGCAVSVLANGVPVTGKTVENGAITLTTRASQIHVGLGYTCDLETMDFNYDTKYGTLQDKVGTVASAMIKVVNTASLQVGPDEDHLTTEDFDDATLTTDDKEVFLVPGTYRECRVFCRVTEPLPCQIIAIIARVSHGDY